MFIRISYLFFKVAIYPKLEIRKIREIRGKSENFAKFSDREN